MIDYSNAIDQKQFDDLDGVFTPDAYIDYRVTGGIDGRFPEVKAWLKEVLPKLPRLLPHARQFRCAHRRRQRVLEDRAVSTRWSSMPKRKGRSCFVGIWYVDEFIRTAQGWRMSKRVEEKCFDKLL